MKIVFAKIYKQQHQWNDIETNDDDDTDNSIGYHDCDSNHIKYNHHNICDRKSNGRLQ